jgi:transposase
MVDQGYTGAGPATAAHEHGIELQVVKLPTAWHGFVLLPRRWVVERNFAWASRFCRSPATTSACPLCCQGCISLPSSV